jgi:hypothetical protein
MLSFTVSKADTAPSAVVITDEPSDSPLTMTIEPAGSEGSSVAPATNTLGTSETTPKPTSEVTTTSCPPHHWVVTHPRSKFSRGSDGDLVETTDHRCKKCGATRLNNVVVPPERATAPGVELGGS